MRRRTLISAIFWLGWCVSAWQQPVLAASTGAPMQVIEAGSGFNGAAAKAGFGEFTAKPAALRAAEVMSPEELARELERLRAKHWRDTVGVRYPADDVQLLWHANSEQELAATPILLKVEDAQPKFVPILTLLDGPGTDSAAIVAIRSMALLDEGATRVLRPSKAARPAEEPLPRAYVPEPVKAESKGWLAPAKPKPHESEQPVQTAKPTNWSMLGAMLLGLIAIIAAIAAFLPKLVRKSRIDSGAAAAAAN